MEQYAAINNNNKAAYQCEKSFYKLCVEDKTHKMKRQPRLGENVCQ